jgi:hypothetical protein
VGNASPARAPVTDGGVRFLGCFAAPATEQAFRRKHLAEDLWVCGLCVLAAMARVALFTHVDFQSLGPDAPFFCLLGGRLLFLLLSAWVWCALRRAPTPAGADRLFFGWCLVLAALTVCGLATRPPTFGVYALLSTVMVLAVYCVVPLPLGLQALLGVSFSLAALAVTLRAGGAPSLLLGAGFLLANAMGAVTSWRAHHRRRQVFIGAVRETELRGQLEQALAEVRTLRGLVRICAWCKRIPDEAEAWQPVEDYVQGHTHAEFTHGICPHCASKQFDQPALQT